MGFQALSLISILCVCVYHFPWPTRFGSPHPLRSPDECTIIRGALDLKNKTVGDCLTSIEHVTMLNYEGVCGVFSSPTIFPCPPMTEPPPLNPVSDVHQIVPFFAIANLCDSLG